MNGISGIGTGCSMMQSMSRRDPADLAQKLFAQLDVSGQGYLEKADLQSAFARVNGAGAASSVGTDDSDIDELFSRLDSDSDGKVTEQEFTDSLTAIEQQVSDILSTLRQNQAMGNMPPPPPPPGGPQGMQDEGFTKDELSSQLEEIGSSDSKRADLLSNIIENFDAADTNGDGKVSFEEAMSFQHQSAGNDAPATPTASDAVAASEDRSVPNAKVMLQIMRLVQAYQLDGASETSGESSLSVSA